MNSSNQIPEKEILKQFDESMELLVKRRSAAIQYTTFLRDISENDRWPKYEDSLAGHVINMNIISAENALILWCHRMWESGGGKITMPNTIGQLKRHSATICDRYLNEIAQTDNKTRKTAWDEQLIIINTKTKELQKKRIWRVLDVMRNENLAHNILESNTRKKSFPAGFTEHGVTRNDLFEFAIEIVKLIERVEYLRSGIQHDFDDATSLFQKYCDAFWSALPIFKDVEDA